MLASSCVFYMFFVPVYILILFATIVIDYYAGLYIERATDQRIKKLWLIGSIVSVCLILFFFKYFNFFDQNLALLSAAIGWNYSSTALSIILPIGLSFHTFQSLSYVIEVYKGRQKAERHFGIYALYVMYFPQLVAGPIERPQNLLHQFHATKNLEWSRIREGLQLALWGLFKKVVVADSLAVYVDTVYGAHGQHNGTSLLIATYFFAIQIYCDFSGYSDMARGISRVYGIDLMKNFNTPYFSASISEFWTRWHISLSTWFRDYVYIPLGGNRLGSLRTSTNLLLVFLLSGFWHGANWTYVMWGLLNGVYLVGERWMGSLGISKLPRVVKVIVTFHLVLITWIFFRAENITAAFAIMKKIALQQGSLFFHPILAQGLLGIAALLLAEFGLSRVGGFKKFELETSSWRWQMARALALIFAIILFGINRGTQFIYFQF